MRKYYLFSFLDFLDLIGVVVIVGVGVVGGVGGGVSFFIKGWDSFCFNWLFL